MHSPQEDVMEFMLAMQPEMVPTISFIMPPTEIRDLRVRLIQEELEELAQAENLCDVADAIGDLLYVVYGAAVSYGIDIEPIFAEIHRSNMSKTDGPIRADGKRLKGPNYSPPDIKGVIEVMLEMEDGFNDEPF